MAKNKDSREHKPKKIYQEFNNDADMVDFVVDDMAKHSFGEDWKEKAREK